MGRVGSTLVLVVVLSVGMVRAREGVLQMLRKRTQHSEFADLLEKTSGLHQVYLNSYVTLFAPSNTAMAAYKGPRDESFLLNHMVSSAVTNEDLGERLTTILAGHPPLWIRSMPTGSNKSVLYVNQARVKFVYELVSSDGKKQFLYLIDSVLEPLVPKNPQAKQDYVDIKAGDLLSYPDIFRLGDYSIDQYANRLVSLGKEKFPQLSSYGKFTFFIPVDSAFESLRVGTIDDEVVRAHIIPDQLLFSRPIKRRSQSVPTLQYNSTRGSLALRVMAKVFELNREIKVESQTVVGTKQHGRGTVEANIIKADIPVQNGVVHLIDKPLVIMASTLWEHLDPSKPNNMRFKMFAEYVQRSPSLSAKLQQATQGTVFIPTNDAFKFLSPDKMNATITKDMDRILGLHFISQSLQSDDIRILKPQADTGMFSTPAGFPDSSPAKVWLWDEDGTIQVDGGGVQAKVVEANVGASNGVIHSINRVLGIPVDSIHEKLSKDPMMTNTFELGNQEHFNEDLKRKDLEFTYLVPTDNAWSAMKDDMATPHKVLFMGGEFSYQSEKVLERHLKVGAAHTVSSLVSQGQLGVIRGNPLVITESVEDGERVTHVSYDGVTARIVRQDLQCTNGYIHLIDRVILKRRDVTLGRAGGILPSVIAITVSWVLSCILL